MSIRRHRLPQLAAATALAALTLSMLAVPAAAAPSRLTINGTLFGCHAFGDAVPGVELTALRVVRGDRWLLRKPVQIAGGEWGVEWGCVREARALRPGDVVSLLANGGVVRSWTVPAIMPRVDPVTDRVAGRVPDDRGRLSVGVAACGLTVSCGPLFDDRDVHVGPRGRWVVDVAAVDPRGIRPTDYAFVEWISARGDSWAVDVAAPYLSVRAGSARVSGVASLGQTVHVTVRAANGSLRGTGTGVADGLRAAWSTSIRKDGRAVSVRVGDVVTADVYPGARLQVIDIGLVLRKESATILAQCWPGRAYRTDVDMADGSGYGTTGVTGTSGRVWVRFAGEAPLNDLAEAIVGCQSPSGNEQTAAVGPS